MAPARPPEDSVRLKTRQLVLHATKAWQHALDSSSDMVAVLDKHLQVITLNKIASNRLGISPDKAVGREYCTLLNHKGGKNPNCPCSKLVMSRTLQTSEAPVTIFGSQCNVTVSPLLDDNGELLAIVHVAKAV